MTYDTRADICLYCGRYTPLPTPLTTLNMRFESRHKGLVIVMSNCNSKWRNDRVAQLRQHIHIDVISSQGCGNMPFPAQVRSTAHYFCVAE